MMLSSRDDTSMAVANSPTQCSSDIIGCTEPPYSTETPDAPPEDESIISAGDLVNESMPSPRRPLSGAKFHTNVSEPAADIESKSRIQIQLFEAKNALSLGKGRTNRGSREAQSHAVGKKSDYPTTKTVEFEASSKPTREFPPDIFSITEEELNEGFKRDNPDIKGEIKLTGVDLPGLIQYSVSKLGKTGCNSISMPSFGLFNKVLLLTFEDDTTVLARIPFNITRAKILSMKSEVATMTYIRLNRPLIPVSRVYAYEANVENPAKVPFMLIEKMPGEHIYDHVLYDKDSSKAEQVLKNIAKVQAELAKPLPFDTIGNLFFKKDLPMGKKSGSNSLDSPETPNDARPGGLEDETPETNEDGADEDFEIGPFVFENQYDSDAVVSGEAGPFRSLKDLFFFLIQHQRSCGEKAWRDILKESDALPPPYEWSPSRGTITDFTKRCLQLCAIVHALKPLDEYSGLCFYHWDLRMGNILIDESTSEITAVLDWDDVRVAPMLLSAAHPEEIRESFCWNEPTKYIISQNNTLAESQLIARWWWREHYRYNMCVLDERFAIGGGQIWEEAEIPHRLYKLLFLGYNEWLEAHWVA